jgi:hypothetical protein
MMMMNLIPALLFPSLLFLLFVQAFGSVQTVYATYQVEEKQEGPAGEAFAPDKDCWQYPELEKCRLPKGQTDCPPGFSTNEDAQCFKEGECPDGYMRGDDDESGACNEEKEMVRCANGDVLSPGWTCMYGAPEICEEGKQWNETWGMCMSEGGPGPMTCCAPDPDYPIPPPVNQSIPPPPPPSIESFLHQLPSEQAEQVCEDAGIAEEICNPPVVEQR